MGGGLLCVPSLGLAACPAGFPLLPASAEPTVWGVWLGTGGALRRRPRCRRRGKVTRGRSGSECLGTLALAAPRSGERGSLAPGFDLLPVDGLFVFAVENENHCDFVKLREMLIRVNMEDLREQTHTRHYELYRRCKLEEMGFKDTDPDSKPFR